MNKYSRKSRKSPKKSRKSPKKSKKSPKKSLKLLDIQRSPRKDKKYRATFQTSTGRTKHTDFGSSGMSDFTKHKDIERRDRYIYRHKKDLQTNDPSRAGYLSMYILWNKPSFNGSLRDYKKRLKIYNDTGKFPKTI